MQKFVGETKSTMTIKVVLNYKAYYSAHFHHHANLYVISIYLVLHLHPSQVCKKIKFIIDQLCSQFACKLNWGEKIS